MTYTKYLLNISLAFIGTVLLFSPTVSLAICVPTPDQWFTATLSFDERTLPEGIKITTRRNVETGKYPIRDIYAIKNTGSKPFYLLVASTLPSLGNPIDSKTGLPSGVESLYKLVSGESYAYVLVTGTRSQREWRRSHDPSTGKAWEPEINEHSLASMGIKLQSVASDNQPENIQPPSSENFTFTAYFDQKPIEIKGIITYQLNQDYDPHAAAKSLNEPCNDVLPVDIPTILSLNKNVFFYASGVLLAIAALVVIYLRKNRK